MCLETNRKKRIQRENARILEKMQRGESLVTVPTQATWFPPRPIIEKSKKDIERLYNISASPHTLSLVTGENDDTSTD